MKQRYIFSLLLSMFALGASAQTEYTVLSDLTASKVTNANFSEGTPVATTVRTYDYDMPDKKGVAEGGEGLYGQQEVPGWTALAPSTNTFVQDRTDGTNARAAGLFAYLQATDETTIGLGGAYYAPMADETLSGNALGFVAVWGAELSYTQEVTLPAGGYMLVFKLFNASGAGEVSKNLFGFIGENASYMSSKKSFPVNEWVEDTVLVRLKAETDLKLSLGFSFGGGSKDSPHLFLDNVRLLEIDPTPLDKAEIDALKVELLKVIEDGEDLGADTSAAQEVYNNENATLAEVQAAIDAQLALNEEKKVDLSAYFINNPHFTKDEPVEGGICTYAKDCPTNGIPTTNFSMLPLDGWTRTKTNDGVAAGVFAVDSEAFLGGPGFLPPAKMSDGSEEGKVLGFVSCWGFTAAYQQSVTIPAGKYQLTISFYNAGGTKAISKNLMGFVTDEGIEYLGETTTFPVGKWVSETIKFELEEETSGYFTMGYTAAEVGSGDMPHFFIDGISLIFSGELTIDPSLLALQSVLSTANKILDENEPCEAALLTQFEEAIGEGEELSDEFSDDVEANQAAYDKLTSLIDEIKASIQAYKDLNSFYDNELNNAYSKYGYLDIAALDQLNTDVETAKDEFTWNTQQIKDAIASLPGIIKDGVQAAWTAAIESGEELEQDLDISPLFEQLAYTYSTTAQQGNNVPDKEWKYGSASNFKTQYGTAEVWNQSPFTVSRTMAEMPAGRYTITTKAFYRNSATADNYSNYDPSNEQAFVFAGRTKTALANMAVLASSEEVSGWSKSGDFYFPGSQQTAQQVFLNNDYTELLQKSVTTTLVENGDLTFGITADEMNSDSWVIWYTFSIAYNAATEEGINEELSAVIEAAQQLYDDNAEDIAAVAKAENDLQEAISNGSDALSGSVDDIKVAINNITAAMDYANKSISLLAEFAQAVADFGTLKDAFDENYTSSDVAFDELIALADEKNSSNPYETNEEIQGYIDALPSAWVAYVLAQDILVEATADEPIDITPAILNADFEAGNIKYWTITGSDENGRIGQNQGYQSASYNNGEITVSHFVEAWRKDGAILSDGDISQTLGAALPAGYYRLSADAFATNQSAIPAEGIQGAYLYIQLGETVKKVNIGIAVTSGSPETFMIDFYSDGTQTAKLGLLVEGTNASWMVADNFTLSYLGILEPDQVEGINADAASARIDAIYSITGARQSALRRGIQIVKTADGAVRKVLVK